MRFCYALWLFILESFFLTHIVALDAFIVLLSYLMLVIYISVPVAHFGYVHTVTFLHGFVLFHNPKGIPVYFQTIENDAKTLQCAHSLCTQSRS